MDIIVPESDATIVSEVGGQTFVIVGENTAAAAASAIAASGHATTASNAAATAVNAPGTSATSTTSLAVGTGSKSLTIQTGKAFAIGQFVTITSTASPANWMHGNITAHNSGTGALTVNVTTTGGTGTIANWTIALSGPSSAIANGSITNAKLANVATATFKGRTTAGTGAPEDLTAAQATALLNAFTAALKGLVPASGGGTVNFLRADGTWAAPGGGGGGTVTSVGGTGTVNGLTLTGTVTTTGNLTLGGTLSGVSLTSAVTGTLPVGNGGTGGTTQETARSGIGAAASGANTDITALDQDVTITATGTIAANTIGYRGMPQATKSSAYTLALADAGKHISITTGGITIPANGSVAFPIGTTIVIYNNSGSTQTIAITTDTLRQAGTTNTGTRTLAAYGLATLVKVASTTWVVTGTVS